MHPSELTMVLPTLNEAGNIRALIDGIRQHVPHVDVIVVDDGSTDGTPEIVADIAKSDPRVRLLSREGPACLTESIQAGVRAAKTPYVGWMDADLSHPPQFIPHLLATAKTSGCAIASRFLVVNGEKNRVRDTTDSLMASVLSVALNILTRYWLKLSVTDYTSGFIVCRSDLLQKHRFVGDYGEYFIEILYHLSSNKIPIVEIPYTSPPRVWGESKTGTNLFKLVRRGLKYLWLAWRLRFPTALFLQDENSDVASGDFHDLVRCHKSCLPHTPSSVAGPKALEALYKNLACSPDGKVIWVPGREDRPWAGAFAAGSADLRTTEQVVRRMPFRVLLKVAMAHLFSPTHLFARWRWEQTIPSHGVGYVLTIGTSRVAGSKETHPPRGSAVLDQLEAWFLERGLTESWVDTECKNKKAIAMYERHGYARVSTFLGHVLLRKELAQ